MFLPPKKDMGGSGRPRGSNFYGCPKSPFGLWSPINKSVIFYPEVL